MLLNAHYAIQSNWIVDLTLAIALHFSILLLSDTHFIFEILIFVSAIRIIFPQKIGIIAMFASNSETSEPK